MGVTINFEGKLKSEKDFKDVLTEAKQFADKNNLPYSLIDEKEKLLLRVKDEKDWDYKGKVRGMLIQPHPNSDPLNLEFDENLYIQEYCKTQFAEIETHILIINFLKQVETYFEKLMVDDEGEFWETNDIDKLKFNIENNFDLIENAKKENPNFEGPFRIEDNRIVDLMEKQQKE